MKITKETIQEIANLAGVTFGDMDERTADNFLNIIFDEYSIEIPTEDDYFDGDSVDALFAGCVKYMDKDTAIDMFMDFPIINGKTDRG